MKKLSASLVLTVIMLFAMASNPSFASVQMAPELQSYLKSKDQKKPKTAKRFTGKMDENDELQISESVNIAIKELVGVDGFECFAGAVYRFSTTSEFRSTPLDVLVTIEDTIGLTDMSYPTIDPVTGTVVTVDIPCVRADDGRIGFWIGGQDRRAFADINYQVVEAGTNIPVKANVITMTVLDLDTDPSDDEVGTDDIYFQSPTTLLVSPESQVTSESGNFFINFSDAGEPFYKYTDKLKGTADSNCGDSTEIADITCRGAASWDSNNIGISDVTFKIINEFSPQDEERDFIVSFRLEDSVGLDNKSPTAILTTSDMTRGLSPLQVNFSGADSFDPDGDIIEYLWDFGDGITATGADVSHTFSYEPCSFSFCSSDRDFEVTLTVTDDRGARATTIRSVSVETDAESTENSRPVIRLLGDSLVFIRAGEPYVEAGAIATDDVSGNIPVIIGGDVVDTNEPGEYRISYNATDGAGAKALTLYRLVKVDVPLPEEEPARDTTAPVITVASTSTVTVSLGQSPILPVVTAVDNVDGNVPVTEASNVDINVPGEYAVVYTATDAAGNTSTVTVLVIVLEPIVVIDTNAPVVTVIGDNPADVVAGSGYIDLGATAVDDTDGSVTVTRSGEVDTSVIGTYIITYSASDVAGNVGSTTRTVNVLESNTPPVVTEGCPRGIFDDGNMYNANAELVENTCGTANEVCPSQFFYGSNTFIDAVCTDGTWQREQGAEPPVVLAACPRGIFENGTMYSAELELVNNSCANEAQVCADQYFYGSQSYQNAVCSNGTWQPEPEACPRGIFANGKMYNAELEFTDNTCSTIDQICDDQYFYENSAYSQAVCTDDGWQEVANTLTLNPRSGATLSAAPVNPKSSPVSVSNTGGGSLGWFSALLLGFGAATRRRRQ